MKEYETLTNVLNVRIRSLSTYMNRFLNYYKKSSLSESTELAIYGKNKNFEIVKINNLILKPTKPAHKPKTKYKVPISLWFVEVNQRNNTDNFF